MADRIKGLKIVLGADTSQLTDAIYKVNTAISKTMGNLRDVNKALKLDPGNVELLKDKQNELTSAIDQTKEKVKTEQEALDALKAKGVSDTSQEFQNLKTQIDIDKASLKDLENQMKDFGSVSIQHLKAVGEKMQEVGTKIADVGKSLTTKVTVPIAAGFTAAIKTAGDFDAQMSKVQAISGSSSDEMDLLSAKARDMGATTKFSATEAGQALEYMAMAGWKTEQMMGGLEGIMYLAAASGEELGTTSDIVTDALTAFGMSAEQSSRFADILASASSNANTNVSMMGESFKYAAAPAGALGYSAEDVAVALGLMANSGIKADMAGTSLRNMFMRMAKPTKESAMAMERLGLELYDEEGRMYSFREVMDNMRKGFTEINMPLEEYNAALDALDANLANGNITQTKYQKELEELNLQAFGAEGAEKARAAAMLGGARAMSGLLAIANATEEDYKKLQQAVDGSSESFAKLADGSVVPLSEALASGAEVLETYNGAAEAMAATMEDNLEGDITKLQSAVQELAISVGEILMPIAEKVVAIVQNIVDYLNSLDESTKQHIVQIAAVVAAIGPVLLVVGKIIVGIGALLTAVGQIHSALALLAPVVSAIGTFITGTIIPALGALLSPIGLVVAAIAAVIAIIVLCIKHWDEIKEVAIKVADTIQQKWEQFKEKMSQLWSQIMENIKNKVDQIKNNTINAFENIKNSVTDKVSNLKAKAVEIFTNLHTSISNTVGNIKQSIVDGFNNAIEFITSLPARAVGWGADIINGIVEGIHNTIGKITDAVSGIAETISSYIHFSVPDKGPLRDFRSYMPDMINEMVKGIDNGIPQIASAMRSLSGAMIPQMGASGATNNENISNVINLSVYGAQGQNINELANVIEEKITENMIRRGAAFG